MVALMPSIVSVVLLSIFSMLSLVFVSVDDVHMGHGCPFMTHQDSICPMDAFEHISAATTALVQTTFMVLVFGGVLLLLEPARNLRCLVRKSILAPPDYQWKQYRFDVRSLQAAYARGILNPKVH